MVGGDSASVEARRPQHGLRPHVKVRRRFRRGRFGPPKSKNAVRDVPLSWTVADGLRKNVGDEEGLVFPSAAGVPLNHSNTYRRKLLPAAEEADVAWATIHTFRHTCASLLFARVAM